MFAIRYVLRCPRLHRNGVSSTDVRRHVPIRWESGGSGDVEVSRRRPVRRSSARLALYLPASAP